MSLDVDVRIAPIGPDDFATVAALGDRIWRQHYASIVSPAQLDYMLARRYTPENLARDVGAADQGMFVVRVDGEPVGYFSYKAISADEMKLEQLDLIAEMRGRGVGAGMKDQVERGA